MMTIALIAGLWTTTCIQTQISNVNSGFVIESYTIEASGSYEFKREWYSDPACKDYKGIETESGLIEMGRKIRTIFVPGDVYEADFNTQKGVDLGAVSVKDTKLRVARGVSNSTMRNTMLGIFFYNRH